MACRAASNIVSSLFHLEKPLGQDVSDLFQEVGYKVIVFRRGSEKWLTNMGCVDKVVKMADRVFLFAAVATRESGKADTASKLFTVRDATATARAITGIAKVAQGCIPDAIRALRNLGRVIYGVWNDQDTVGLRTKKTEWDFRRHQLVHLESISLVDTNIYGVRRYSGKNDFRCKLALVGFKQVFTFVDKTCFSVAFLVFNPINVAGRFCGDAISDSLRSSSKQGMTILMATCQSSALMFCFLDIGDAVLYGDSWTGFNDKSTGRVTVLGTIWDRSGKIAVKSLQLSMSIINLGHIPVHPLVLPTIDLVATFIELCDAVRKFNPNNPDYGNVVSSPAQRAQAQRAQAAINSSSDDDS